MIVPCCRSRRIIGLQPFHVVVVVVVGEWNCGSRFVVLFVEQRRLVEEDDGSKRRDPSLAASSRRPSDNGE